MTRRAILLKWILYCLCALALALLQGLVLVYVRVWGVHPFLLPAIAVIPATLERNEQALLYAVFFGLACDLLSPVAGLPCFYALAFLLGAAAAWLLSGQVIMAGVVCSLVVTGVCMLLCGLLHMAVLAGHSGAGLKFTLNGETKILKGTAFTPAVITVNDKPAALTTKIKQGDSITLMPAVNGENAHAFIRDYADNISRVSVIFCGENAVAGKRAYANGKEVGKDYEILPLDNIEIHDARTLGAFLMQYGGDTQTATVYVNGEEKPESYVLCDGDILGFDKGSSFEAVQAAAESASGVQTAEDIQTAEQGNFVSVIFNGVPTDLPEKESKTPYMLIDLFERANIDIENPTRRLVLTVNGKSAKFTDKIQSGDIVVIKQEG